MAGIAESVESANDKNISSVRLSIAKFENTNLEVEQILRRVSFTVPFAVSALENNNSANMYCERIKKDMGNLKGAKIGLILSLKEETKINVEVKGLVRLFSNDAVLEYFVKEESKLEMKAVFGYKDLTVEPRIWKTIEVEIADLKICHASGNRDNYIGLATVASAWRSDGKYQIKLKSLVLNLEVLMCMEAGNLVKPKTGKLMNLVVELEGNPLHFDLILIAKNGFRVKCHSLYIGRHNPILELMCEGASYLNPLEVRLDMSKNCLRTFINYLYELFVNDWKYVRGTPEVAMEIIIVAKKYDIAELGSSMLDLVQDMRIGWLSFDGSMEELEDLHEYYESSPGEELGRFCYLVEGTPKCEAGRQLEMYLE